MKQKISIENVTFWTAKESILTFGDIENSLFLEFIAWLRRKRG